ncbi:MAG TPA: hypothetical protein DCQ06_03210 [Myxococcales bacterium]|nr:hypothetical protein [Myxococcales bacterium]
MGLKRTQVVWYMLGCLLAVACSDKETSPEPGLDASLGNGQDIQAADATVADVQQEVVGNTCQPGQDQSPVGPFFSDISVESGIQVGNYVQNPSKAVPINDHSRLGFVDINGDGLDDIVTHSLFPNPKAGVPFEHLIFVNQGDGTFGDFSAESGLRDVQAGFFAFGDVDNDGDQDCFAGLDTPLNGVTHQILLNDGSGRFTAKPASGVETLPPVAGNAVFADFDGDAKLDLFVGMGHTSYSMKNHLLMGQGDGTFTLASNQLSDPSQQPTNGSVACDYDNDGDLDILVSNYGVSVASGHNKLYRNDGGGQFSEVAEEAGFAYQATGNPWLESKGDIVGDEPSPGPTGYIGGNGFGLDCADVNGDGFLDVFATAISHPNVGDYKRKWSDGTMLLYGKPGGGGLKYQVATGVIPFNEGDVDGATVDFDNDGRLDLSVSRDKKYEKNYDTDDQKAWFGLLRQNAGGYFESLGLSSGINAPDAKTLASLDPCSSDSDCKAAGETCLVKRCRTACSQSSECSGGEICHTGGFCKIVVRMKNAQNHAWADIDADGDMDLLVGGRDTGGGRPNFLFRNDIGQQTHWLQLRLLGDGVKVNRDAIGARVVLRWPGGRSLLREVKSSRGMHNSMDSRWVHLGLGAEGCNYTVTITWPDGKQHTFKASELAPRARYDLSYPDALKVWKQTP